MAVKAIHAFGCVQAHFVFVNYGILSACMTLSHFPVARTNSALGCAVSTLGRARLIRTAAKTSAKAMVTARKTARKDIRLSLNSGGGLRIFSDADIVIGEIV
jgi:hypothetical protein